MASEVNRGESTPLPIERMSRIEFASLPTMQSDPPLSSAGLTGAWKRRIKNRRDCDKWIVGCFVHDDDRWTGIDWHRIEIID